MKKIILSSILFLTSLIGISQPCLTSYTFTASPPPNNGNYNCGEVVTFCLTVNTWNTTNANWIHGIVPSFGAGWDLSTLTPGLPPSTVGGSGGTWDWWLLVSGTSGVGVGPIGPGFFFDLDNDGNPGNNFGDLATVGPWTFCWSIAVNSGPNCINGDDLTASVDIFGDSETGSWGAPGCGGDIVPSLPASTSACPTAGIGSAIVVCSDNSVIDLFGLLGGDPSPMGSWVDPIGNSFIGQLDPSNGLSGDYIYTVNSPNCPQSIAIVNVIINHPPNAGSDNSIILCDSLIGYDLMSLVNGDVGGSWIDPNGNPSSGMINSISIMNGIYQYTVNGNPCLSESADINVTIQYLGYPGEDGFIDICQNGDPIDINPVIQNPDNGGFWINPIGNVDDNLFNPSNEIEGLWTYVLPGIGSCQGIDLSSDLSIDIIERPNIDLFIAPPYGCYPLDASFDVQISSIITNYDWIFGDGNSSNIQSPQNTYLGIGNFNINLSATDVFNCIWEVDSIINVYDPPNSDFYHLPPDPLTTNNLNISFFPIEPTNSNLNTWTILGNHINGENVNWTFPYLEESYEICLLVVDTIGCVSETCKIIKINDSFTIFVPNSFTPDNDGVNDYFYPIITGDRTEETSVSIFDRWGSEIFSCTGKISPWDGSKNGTTLPNDVYVWRIVSSDRYSSERKEYFGHVVLLR